jgi:hypothetical protein
MHPEHHTGCAPDIGVSPSWKPFICVVYGGITCTHVVRLLPLGDR